MGSGHPAPRCAPRSSSCGRQGHAARRPRDSRPRPLERGIVLHQPGRPGGPGRSPAVRRAALPGPLGTAVAHHGAQPRGDRPDARQDVRCLAHRARGLHQGFGVHGPSSAATLSTKHTLALTNRGAASAAEVVELARTVRDGVLDAFGIALVPEPVLVGVAL
ncbi:hypothetical protein NKG05_05685 [Oerskovia sp. M15]